MADRSSLLFSSILLSRVTCIEEVVGELVMYCLVTLPSARSRLILVYIIFIFTIFKYEIHIFNIYNLSVENGEALVFLLDRLFLKKNQNSNRKHNLNLGKLSYTV